MGIMFSGCKALKSIRKLNVSKVSNFNGMFDNCDVLSYVGLYSTNSVNIVNAVNALPTHTDAEENAYVIDISSNDANIINELFNLSRDGWTIKTTV